MSDTGTASTATSADARVVVYPSATLRPIPSFVFAVPSGWVLDEVPDALAVLRTPEQVDDFWINATISHDRVGRAVDLEKAAQATWARIQRESPSAQASMEKMARFGSNVVYLRGIELEAPQSNRPLAQLQALFFAPPVEGAKTADFFQIICTAPPAQMPAFGPVFVGVISSFQFA